MLVRRREAMCKTERLEVEFERGSAEPIGGQRFSAYELGGATVGSNMLASD